MICERCGQIYKKQGKYSSICKECWKPKGGARCQIGRNYPEKRLKLLGLL
jgi:hypothetical protein